MSGTIDKIQMSEHAAWRAKDLRTVAKQVNETMADICSDSERGTFTVTEAVELSVRLDRIYLELIQAAEQCEAVSSSHAGD